MAPTHDPESVLLETARQALEILPLAVRNVAAGFRRMQLPIVPAQVGVLSLLKGQSYNLSQLADLHAVSLPTMSNTVTRLVDLGLVQRNRDPEDRRVTIIEITPEGCQLLQEASQQMVQEFSQLLASLPQEQLTKLQDGLVILRSLILSAQANPTH